MKKSLVIATCLLCAMLTLSGCGEHFHEYSHTVVSATCRSTGYSLFVCDCGERQYRNYTAVIDHKYGEWRSYTPSTLLSFGKEYRACLHCGNLEFRDTAMSEDTPSIFLTEDGSFVLYEGAKKTTYRATLEISGSAGHKAEYLLTDVLGDKQEGIRYSDFRLDPCTPDRTYARASTAESLWYDSIQLRRQEGLLPAWVPTEVREDITVRVFMNGVYVGLYRLLPASPLRENTKAVIQAMSQDDSCLFLESPIFDEAINAFSLLSYSGESPEEFLQSFETFSKFVRESSTEQFREELANYSDPATLMDYFLLTVFYGFPTGDAMGTVWSTADGVHWTPSFSSLNNAFGLSVNGYQNTALDGIPFVSAEETEEPTLAYSGKNLLWQKLCEAFPAQLMDRYEILRNSFLTKDNVCTLYLDAYASINNDLRKLERDLYPVLPDGAWSARHVETYVENRLKKMDEWLYPKKV